MGDNRNGQNGRNNSLDVGPSNRTDLFLRSESPLVQQILLHQKLKEEIEKNSAGRVRYVDSELYLRNQDRSQGALEVQSTTLNIGIANKPITSRQSHNNKSSAQSNRNDHDGDIPMTCNDSSEHANNQQHYHNQTSFKQHQLALGGQDGNCPTCLVKEVRHNLMNLTKIVQERNEQLSKLKAKRLKSFFERQMSE